MLPETMTVIEAKGSGGPEVLVPAMRPLPEPGPGEVLVGIAAAGINRPDVLQRQELVPRQRVSPICLGSKWRADREARCGGHALQARRRRLCARQWRRLRGYAVAPEATTLPVPQGLSTIEAAALPETVFTVWNNVFERAALKPSEWLLVHGGTSGIGTTAIRSAGHSAPR